MGQNLGNLAKVFLQGISQHRLVSSNCMDSSQNRLHVIVSVISFFFNKEPWMPELGDVHWDYISFCFYCLLDTWIAVGTSLSQLLNAQVPFVLFILNKQLLELSVGWIRLADDDADSGTFHQYIIESLYFQFLFFVWLNWKSVDSYHLQFKKTTLCVCWLLDDLLLINHFLIS